MPQILTSNFKVYSASQFVDSLAGTNSLYLFIGRPLSWENDISPPSPINNEFEDNNYWADSIALKKITPNDVKLVVRRVDWVSGTVYSQYDNTNPILNTNFYVLTHNENNVYKCLFNNNGALSTDMPSSRSSSIITTADGYRWKYLYSLTDADLLKFLTNNYMPVNIDGSISSTALRGTLDNIVVTNSGNGYINASNINVQILGNGTSANISAIGITAENTIQYINLDNIGYNYTYANIVISGGGGANAAARAVISPYNGHGYIPSEELGAYYVMINTRLDYAEGAGDFPVLNDYRRIGIVKNPISNLTSSIATETTLSSTYSLNLSNITGTFSIDELIIGGNTNANAVVLTANVSANTGIIRFVQPIELCAGNLLFSIGETLRGNTSMASAKITNINYPNVKHNTGKVLYVENRRKITRTYDQAENIHIVIEF